MRKNVTDEVTLMLRPDQRLVCNWKPSTFSLNEARKILEVGMLTDHVI
jgi:hypothetical protein